MKRWVLFFGFLWCVGCAQNAEIQYLTHDYQISDKSLFLLSESDLNRDLRVALAKRGYKLLKFASQKHVLERLQTNKVEIYKKASARYGIDISYQTLDRCLTTNAQKINMTTELIDTQTNEVVAVIYSGGWTGYCPLAPRWVFDEFADSLDEIYAQSK